MSQTNSDNHYSDFNLAHYQPQMATTALYFAPLLPWQIDIWTKLTSDNNRLAHGLLFSGMQGIGKRAFVRQFSAWMLCDNKNTLDVTDLNNERSSSTFQTACGECQSCLWLKAGTHPRLKVLPNSSILSVDDEYKSGHHAKTTKKKIKSTAKAKTKSVKANANDGSKVEQVKVDTIKVDDIRELTPFVKQSSSGRRICIIDNAEMMTIAAANALLKTLEEPNDGVHLFLISDMPAKLLPTIKSRLQKVPIDKISPLQAKNFLENITQTANKQNNGESEDYSNIKTAQTSAQIEQLLSLASGAPLAALDMLQAPWYAKRQLWLTTWLALRTGKRSSSAASDYWQQQLSLAQFVQLSEIMLMDIKRVRLAMQAKQKDIGLDDIKSIKDIPFEDLQQVSQVIADIELSVHQNVQEKLGYDKLMSQLAQI